ncbi:3-isopropylmalate dehydrogenase [candidate division KSB1 bacterium]|nr:3-isopropylmalate dehydrogenase [candidate division KSB1 bacterium]
MKDQYQLAILPGDGIGPEVVEQAVTVLNCIAEVKKIKFEYLYADVGGVAIDKYDTPLPAETLALCKQCDAVLLGAIGAPKYDNLPPEKRPEKGLMNLRAGLGLFANLRPVKVYPGLADASSLKREVIEGVDLLIVRELTGCVYFGEPRGIENSGGRGLNTMVYTKNEVERIAKVAFEAAQKRSKRVMSVDKANVLEVSQFWRKIVVETAEKYPDVELNHMYVDNCAMQLVRQPSQFDVILTGNMFGDILSDVAAMLTGSLGMLPSASLGSDTALYEPVHGSAPDIAGRNIANPIATISSAAIMLEHSLNMAHEAHAVEKAIAKALQDRYCTADILIEGGKKLSTTEMGRLLAENVKLFL